MITLRKKFFCHEFLIGLENLHYKLIHEGRFIHEPEFDWMPHMSPGSICWDMGCSFGIWSYFAATFPFNYKVVAFDLSPKAAALCKRNTAGFDVQVVDRPITISEVGYIPPASSHQENKLKLVDCKLDRSISFKDAIKRSYE